MKIKEIYDQNINIQKYFRQKGGVERMILTAFYIHMIIRPAATPRNILMKKL